MRSSSWPLLGVLTLLTAPAGASPLEDAPASWRGSGEFKTEMTGPAHEASCRIDTAPLTGADGFSVSGKCASPSGSATINLSIQRVGQGRVAAAMGSSVLDEVVQMSGREGENGITLVSRAPLDFDDQDVSLQIDLKWPSANAITINEWVTPINAGTMTQIVWMTLNR
jgi:hypothetical protein